MGFETEDIDQIEIYHHPDSEEMSKLALIISNQCIENGIEEDCSIEIVPTRRLESNIMHISQIAVGLHYIGRPEHEKVVHFLEDLKELV